MKRDLILALFDSNYIVFVSTKNTFSFRFRKIKTSVFLCFVANLAVARHGANDEFWKVETSEFLDKKVGMSNCMKGLASPGVSVLSQDFQRLC